jgi:hypothetical protein
MTRNGGAPAHPGLFRFHLYYNNRNQLWKIKSGNTVLATYTIDNLNQYSARNGISATYGTKGTARLVHGGANAAEIWALGN